MNKIAVAFIKAKKSFAPVLKDRTNPYFKSKYADLGACLDAVDEALLDNGIALYQETFEDLSGVTVETVFLHESGETIRSGKLHVPAAKQDPQGYGSALTYARRYSLMTACGIAPEDDDGNAASTKPAPKQQHVSRGVFEDCISNIKNAIDIAQLKTVFTEAYMHAESLKDSHSMAIFSDAKDLRKKQITYEGEQIG